MILHTSGTYPFIVKALDFRGHVVVQHTGYQWANAEAWAGALITRDQIVVDKEGKKRRSPYYQTVIISCKGLTFWRNGLQMIDPKVA